MKSNENPVTFQVPTLPLLIPKFKVLFSENKILTQLVKLELKAKKDSHRLGRSVLNGRLADLLRDKKRSAKLVYSDLITHYPHMQPAEYRVAGKKGREFFKFNLLDNLAESIIVDFLNESMGPNWSADLFSYQKGKSAHSARVRVKKYLKSINKKETILGIKADIKSYAESLGLLFDSPFMQYLKKNIVFENSEDELFFNYLLRPVYHEKGNEKVLVQRVQGIPLGTSLSCFIFNFYLHDLDQKLSEIENIHYTRYGDDILILSTVEKNFKRAYGVLENTLTQKNLALNNSKSLLFCLNNSGHNYLRSKLPIQRHIDYLGLRILRNGNFVLNTEKTRSFMCEIKRILRNADRINLNAKDKMIYLIEAVNSYIEFSMTYRMPSHFELIRQYVDNRSYLKGLDFHIAMVLSSQLSGIRGIKTFRYYSMGDLYSSGLISIVDQVNRWRK